MGEGDLMPTGGHHKKYDPKRAKKIKDGGKKADAIRRQAEEYHENTDVPSAEDQLLSDLYNLSK